MPTVLCPSREELSLVLRGKGPQRRLAELDNHLETCADCQAALQTIHIENDSFLDRLRSVPVASESLERGCAEALERVRRYGAELSSSNEPGSGASDTPPTFIREYKLLEKLGEGGMGTVYKAQHTRLDKTVALKLLASDRIRNQPAVARFQREMKAVGKLEHPNIVRAMDAGEVEGLHFLVMEYVPGLDLSQLARRLGRLPIPEACELIRQAAAGLAEAHEHGMVHRDIKPSNLILARPRKREEPQVKILDLGLALLSGEAPFEDNGLTGTGQMMGTIDYMAPEQGRSSHDVDIRADIYSLGATLYRLLAGKSPLDGPGDNSMLSKLVALATRPAPALRELRKEVPAELAAVVHRMLAKDPAGRYATPHEVVEALSPYCSGADLRKLLQDAERQTQASDVTGESDTLVNRKSQSADTATTIPKRVLAPAGRQNGSPPSRRMLALGLGGGAALLLAAIVLYWVTDRGIVKLVIHDPEIEVQFDGQGATITNADKEPIKLRSGKHRLFVLKRGDFEFETDSFDLQRSGVVTLEIKQLQGEVQVVDEQGNKLGSHSPRSSSPDPKAPAPAIAPFDAEQAKQHQQAWADQLKVPVEFTDELGITFRLIPPGEFMMGSTKEEIARELKVDSLPDWYVQNVQAEGPQHLVRLTRPFYLGVHEITTKQFSEFVERKGYKTDAERDGKGGTLFKEGKLNYDPDVNWRSPTGEPAPGDTPVRQVSWNDARAFCASPEEDADYRLPTEAEWEFACRAGTQTRFSTGDQLTPQQAALDGASAAAIGSFPANPFGLHDMHGNATEWCQNSLSTAYEGAAATDPVVENGTTRVFRGGSSKVRAVSARSAARRGGESTFRTDSTGFRVALSIESARRHLGNGSKPRQAEVAPAPPDYALAFDGQMRVRVPSLDVDRTKPFTLEAWVKPLKVPKPNATTVVSLTPSTGLRIEPGSDGNGLWSFGLGDVATAVSKVPPELNRRVHVAGVRTAKEIILFIDGKVVARVATGDQKPQDTSKAYIGNAGKFAFEGQIDQVRISDGIRYPKEFTPAQRLEAEDETLALFHFDEGRGVDIKDSSGNGYHAHIQDANYNRLPDSAGDAKWVRVPKPHESDASSSSDPDRAAAHWIIKQGGIFDHSAGPQVRTVKDIPQGPFKVLSVVMRGASIRDEDLKQFQGLTGLYVLDLAGCPISDVGLTHLVTIPSLEELELTGTNITPDAIFSLSKLPRLKGLYIGNTKFPPNRFSRLKELPHLVNFSYCDPAFDDARHLAQLPPLELLRLNHSGIDDEDLREVAKLKSVVNLQLERCPIGDAGLAYLAEMTQLQSMEIGGTKITNEGLAALASLPNLNRVALMNLAIDDGCVPVLSSARQLKVLWLQNTKLTAEGIATLHALLPRCRIVWDGPTVEPSHERPVGDLERDLTGLALRVGGNVVVRLPGEEQDRRIIRPIEFPLKAFEIVHLSLPSPQINNTHLESIPALKQLQGLNLERAAIDDDALLLLNEPPELWQVILKGTKVTGSGLERLTNQKLHWLEFDGLQEANEGCRHLAKLTGLRNLRMVNCDLSDAGLAHLTSVHELGELGLANTKVGDAGLTAHLSSLTAIWALDLAGTQVTSEGLKHLSPLTKLVWLSLAGTKLEGQDLALLQKLPQLQRIDLTKLPIGDDDLPALKPLTKLKLLELKGTNVSDTAVAELHRALPACRIEWDGGILEAKNP